MGRRKTLELRLQREVPIQKPHSYKAEDGRVNNHNSYMKSKQSKRLYGQ